MSQISPEALQSLASKLEQLDLDDTERALLDGILDRAEAFEPEVEGFGFSAQTYSYTGLQSGSDLSGMSLKLAGSLGFVTRPSLGYDSMLDPDDGPSFPPPP